jgi:hypothetical protein
MARSAREAGMSWSVSPPFSTMAARFAGLDRRIRGKAAVMATIADQVTRPAIEEQFERGGVPSWAALSSETVRTRQSQDTWPGEGGNQPVLRRTGKLKRAALAKARWRITNQGAAYGFFPRTVYYARFAHDGRDGQPARPFVRADRRDAAKAAGILSLWVLRHMREEFPRRFTGASSRRSGRC